MDLETGTEKLLARIEDGVGWLTYNSPARLNALSMSMQQAVPTVLDRFQADDDVRVIVTTGAGGKAFVSGADISEFGEKRTSPEARAEYDAASAEVGRAYAGVEKPILAMIQGYCIGGGLITAMAADIRICGEGSQFGVPAARLGLGYAYGGVHQLIQLVGPAWASEILFSARRLSADEARTIGLVNRVVPADELETVVRELATTIAGNAPMTVRAAKAAIREARRDEASRDVAKVNALVEACFRSQDYVEGQAAFMDKRPAVFTGH